MAGQKGKSGRQKRPGKLYRFTFRFIPGCHPPELEARLEAIELAGPAERHRLLEDLLITGSMNEPEQSPGESKNEDVYTKNLLDALFDQF